MKNLDENTNGNDLTECTKGITCLKMLDRENVSLTMAAATLTSVVVVLATSRNAPVLMFTIGLCIFCLILNVGWRAAGAEACLSAGIWPLACLWIWLALLFWFAYLSGPFWLWSLGAVLICAWVAA